MGRRYVRVVSLWVHSGQETAFEAFERDAARIMARHGGRIDYAVRLTQPEGAPGPAPYELHVVSFPTPAAFDAYAADPDTVALKPLREAIIAKTVLMAGMEAGPY
jgi:uncharacterized protein (DUF1330 family)